MIGDRDAVRRDASDPVTVSVAMATYNGAAYIDRLLASIAAQTRLPDELVVRDDGSTDDTVARVRAFAGTAPFVVRIVENGKRLGYRSNFIAAGVASSGSLVFFCDQDDVWLPAKIARMVDAFDDPDVLLAYHNATVVRDDYEIGIPLYDAEEQRVGIASGAPQPFHFSLGFTQAYRRRLHDFDDLWSMSVDHVADRPEHLAHDQWFFLLAMTLGRVAYVDEALVRYRQHAANVYGVGQDATWSSASTTRVKQFVLAPAWADRARADGATARARIMTAIVDRSEGREQDLARVYAERYARLARRLDRRDASAYGPRLSSRLGAWWATVANRDYGRRDPWAFRWGWMFGDLARAIRGASRADSRGGR